MRNNQKETEWPLKTLKYEEYIRKPWFKTTTKRRKLTQIVTKSIQSDRKCDIKQPQRQNASTINELIKWRQTDQSETRMIICCTTSPKGPKTLISHVLKRLCQDPVTQFFKNQYIKINPNHFNSLFSNLFKFSPKNINIVFLSFMILVNFLLFLFISTTRRPSE